MQALLAVLAVAVAVGTGAIAVTNASDAVVAFRQHDREDGVLSAALAFIFASSAVGLVVMLVAWLVELP